MDNGLRVDHYLNLLGPEIEQVTCLDHAAIIVLPGAPLVSGGPYRYISHPNYAVVAAEIALLPLALHLPVIALVFSALNAAMLAIRIRAESDALTTSSGRAT